MSEELKQGHQRLTSVSWAGQWRLLAKLLTVNGQQSHREWENGKTPKVGQKEHKVLEIGFKKKYCLANGGAPLQN